MDERNLHQNRRSAEIPRQDNDKMIEKYIHDPILYHHFACEHCEESRTFGVALTEKLPPEQRSPYLLCHAEGCYMKHNWTHNGRRGIEEARRLRKENAAKNKIGSAGRVI